MVILQFSVQNVGDKEVQQMDLVKMGSFMKELRKEKGMTQEQFAEEMGVSNRTVSRWETGSNTPDLDILIEISEFYDVDLREILDGERKSGTMNQEMEETVLKVADYSSEEKQRYARNVHFYVIVGLIALTVYIALEGAGLADSGWTEQLASFCCGGAFGVMIWMAVYTSRYMSRIRDFKKRIIKR